MRTLALELGVAQRVWFLGMQTDMDVVYHAADLLVHPTLEDTYAMVVLEAMAHGVPVVVSGAPWCGISAELRDGLNAIVLQNPASSSEVSDRIATVLGDQGLARALADQGLIFARGQTWEAVATRYETINQDVRARLPGAL